MSTRFSCFTLDFVWCNIIHG